MHICIFFAHPRDLKCLKKSSSVSKTACLWVPVTTAWCVLRLQMEEWPPIWRVAVNKLNK